MCIYVIYEYNMQYIRYYYFLYIQKKKKLCEVLKLLKAKCSRKQNSQAISRTQESLDLKYIPTFALIAVVANMAIVNLVISRPERSVAPLSRRSTVHSAKLRKWQCSKIQNLMGRRAGRTLLAHVGLSLRTKNFYEFLRGSTVQHLKCVCYSS